MISPFIHNEIQKAVSMAPAADETPTLISSALPVNLTRQCKAGIGDEEQAAFASDRCYLMLRKAHFVFALENDRESWLN